MTTDELDRLVHEVCNALLPKPTVSRTLVPRSTYPTGASVASLFLNFGPATPQSGNPVDRRNSGGDASAEIDTAGARSASARSATSQTMEALADDTLADMGWNGGTATTPASSCHICQHFDNQLPGLQPPVAFSSCPRGRVYFARERFDVKRPSWDAGCTRRRRIPSTVPGRLTQEVI